MGCLFAIISISPNFTPSLVSTNADTSMMIDDFSLLNLTSPGRSLNHPPPGLESSFHSFCNASFQLPVKESIFKPEDYSELQYGQPTFHHGSSSHSYPQEKGILGSNLPKQFQGQNIRKVYEMF